MIPINKQARTLLLFTVTQKLFIVLVLTVFSLTASDLFYLSVIKGQKASWNAVVVND